MKFGHFSARSSALGSFSLLAACALAVGSGGCRLEISDGSSSDNGGERSGPDTTSGDSGARNTSGGAANGSSGAANGSSGAPSNGQGGAASSAGGAGQSAGASTASNTEEDCSNSEKIANNDREHAVAFGSRATLCVLNDSDSDWFYVDTPSDGRAHVVQLDISETDGSWIDIYLTAEKDGSDMGRIHPSQRGLKLSSFVVVGPGTRTFFEVQGYVNNTDTSTIDVSVSAEADDHEPNNDQATATLIQSGSEVSAQLILPYVSRTDQQIQDVYKAELPVGKHTFEMKSVPSDLFPVIEVRDSTDTVISDNNHGPNRGAQFSFTFTAAEAGTYYFRVENYVDVAIVSSGTKADSYAQPYKFQLD